LIDRLHGINANLLFKWRRDHQREATSLSTAPAVLLPVRVASPDEDPCPQLTSRPQEVASTMAKPVRSGVIEVEVAGVLLRLRGAVDEANLCSVLRALRQSA